MPTPQSQFGPGIPDCNCSLNWTAGAPANSGGAGTGWQLELTSVNQEAGGCDNDAQQVCQVKVKQCSYVADFKITFHGAVIGGMPFDAYVKFSHLYASPDGGFTAAGTCTQGDPDQSATQPMVIRADCNSTSPTLSIEVTTCAVDGDPAGAGATTWASEEWGFFCQECGL